MDTYWKIILAQIFKQAIFNKIIQNKWTWFLTTRWKMTHPLRLICRINKLSKNITDMLQFKPGPPVSYFKSEMSLGFQFRVCKQYYGGHNLHPPTRSWWKIVNSGWAKAHLAHHVTTSLQNGTPYSEFCRAIACELHSQLQCQGSNLFHCLQNIQFE